MRDASPGTANTAQLVSNRAFERTLELTTATLPELQCGDVGMRSEKTRKEVMFHIGVEVLDFWKMDAIKESRDIGVMEEQNQVGDVGHMLETLVECMEREWIVEEDVQVFNPRT